MGIIKIQKWFSSSKQVMNYIILVPLIPLVHQSLNVANVIECIKSFFIEHFASINNLIRSHNGFTPILNMPYAFFDKFVFLSVLFYLKGLPQIKYNIYWPIDSLNPIHLQHCNRSLKFRIKILRVRDFFYSKKSNEVFSGYFSTIFLENSPRKETF